MRHKGRIHLLIDNAVRLDFFSKVSANEKIAPSILYHANLATWLIAKFKKIPGQQILLRRTYNGRSSKKPSIEEVKQHKRVSYSLNKNNIPKIQAEDKLWVFSGFQFTALELIPLYSSVRYFEIANFPNKYQSSDKGVNADADHHMKVKAMINNNDKMADDILKLKELLLKYRPSHVDASISSKALEQLINLIGFYAFSTIAPHSSPIDQIKIARDIRQTRKLIASYQSCPTPDVFNLFIGQVAQDSQTLFQSTVNSIEAIALAHKASSDKKIPLVVRLHPGEKKPSVIKEQIEYCKENNIIISNKGALLESVSMCNEVFTINSTGGLQSLLFNKPVTTYGQCFYRDWNDNDVVTYYKYVLKNI
ncbi:hypothetical protein ACP43V_09405 [Vibrio genomosp. F10 str. 9ZC157]|uniref:Capsular biosynthesis protein n=1 Tax=Vibrio genomosp. F10 str. ZF-129 TaxID=1187848 RepID=A0A1E5BDE8_9VIBR|nr:hypothetical protein [Vibrio genomosp. F10]OEE33150.1 hypothetical protein A1QO_10745 [Vibrio genomosp. F10 str. ZF-129]OEE95651.1 hypothetical protein A1QM_04745 [Vibrio genomosp. F10 str. 9ZC157]